MGPNFVKAAAKKYTIKDVAREAEVGVGTVSKY